MSNVKMRPQSPIRLYRTVISALAAVAFPLVANAGGEAAWQELKGKHFIVSYEGSEKFAREVLDAAEALYDGITEKLGFTRFDNFWLWDERARIRLYAGRDAFVKGENAPGWAAGKALVKGREIMAFEGIDDFCSTVLPHELSHLIFREFTGLGKDVPAWLDEGVAQLQEKDRKKGAELLRAAGKENGLFPLAGLMTMRPENIEDGKLAVFYAQSLSLVAFMIEKHGPERFRKFCGALKDGRSVDEALRFTYQDSISSIEHLEKAWLKQLEESE